MATMLEDDVQKILVTYITEARAKALDLMRKSPADLNEIPLASGMDDVSGYVELGCFQHVRDAQLQIMEKIGQPPLTHSVMKSASFPQLFCKVPQIFLRECGDSDEQFVSTRRNDHTAINRLVSISCLQKGQYMPNSLPRLILTRNHF